MNDNIKSRCDLFIDNAMLIKKKAGFENDYIKLVAALLYTTNGVRADADKMIAAKKVLKSKTGFASSYRGMIEQVIITYLDLDDYSEVKMEKILSASKALRKHFSTDSFTIMAAIVISNMTVENDYERAAERTKTIYRLMKKQHPFLTSKEDCTAATLLAFSHKSDEQIIQDMEWCYEYLKHRLYHNNPVQGLSAVLALSDMASEAKCEKTILLYKALKERGRKYSTYNELPALGALVNLDVNIDELAQNIVDADDYIKKNLKYGFGGLSKDTRLMYAAVFTMIEYSGEGNNAADVNAISSAVAVAIAEEAAMCCAIAACAAASAAASSN